MSSLYSFGIGIGTKNSRGEWLEVFYPTPLLNPPKDLVSVITSSLGANSGDMEPTTDQLSALHSALNSSLSLFTALFTSRFTSLFTAL